MGYLPINLQLEGRRCVIVGGGKIALQKARVLAGTGAQMTVIAPRILPEMDEVPGVTCVRRAFRDEDLESAFIAIAASNDLELNRRVHEQAEARRVLVNVVDDPLHCQFIFPSILRRGDLAVSVSTAGAGPALARMLREELEPLYPADYGQVLARLRELRSNLRQALVCPGAVRAGAEALSKMALKAREGDRLSEELERMEKLKQELEQEARRETRRTSLFNPGAGDTASATDQSEKGWEKAGTPASGGMGRLTLVGAGPGDPELITLAGLRALAEADVVIYDRLVHPQLLNHAPGAVHLYLGKRPGEPHQPTQDRIHQLIVEHCGAGRHVVRLKGGDPMIFGRAGEELEHAARHGIPARVIPGVTSALGAAASSGIPLTHRDLASSVAFVTGCADPASGRCVDWSALSRAVETIVIYMGVENLTEIAAALADAGRPAAQPVAIICKATLTDEKVYLTSLGDLAAGLMPEDLVAPACVIVGEVARCRQWVTQAALSGASMGA